MRIGDEAFMRALRCADRAPDLGGGVVMKGSQGHCGGLKMMDWPPMTVQHEPEIPGSEEQVDKETRGQVCPQVAPSLAEVSALCPSSQKKGSDPSAPGSSAHMSLPNVTQTPLEAWIQNFPLLGRTPCLTA